MLKLDHITVIAPTLAEGCSHVRACLDLDVPFGQRHDYMGTYNHLLQLGDTVYLEIVALDPEADKPRRQRWFGLGDQKKVRTDWDEGRRLRGWVARTDSIDAIIVNHQGIFGEKVPLPAVNSSFDFAVPDDGSLPLDGAAPSIIDRRGKARNNGIEIVWTMFSGSREREEQEFIAPMDARIVIAGTDRRIVMTALRDRHFGST